MTRNFIVHTTAKDIRVTLAQRGDSAHFHAAFWHKGKRHRESTHCAVLAGAERAARQLVLDALEARPPGGGLPLATAVRRYMTERWPKPEPGQRTREDFKSRLGIFQAGAGAETDLAALNYDQAAALTQKFIADRKSAGDANQTQLNYRRVLSAFYGWLLTTRDASGPPLVSWRFNPATKQEIKIGPVQRRLQPPLTAAQVDAFMSAASGKRIFASIVVCLGAGARPIEAARLTWSHVDLDAGTLILHGKNRPRTVIASAWLLAHLKKLKEIAGDEYACALHKRAQSRQLKRLKSRHALPPAFTLQALRRTAACKAAPHMKPQDYAEYFGHSLTVAQKHYIGYGLNGDRAAVEVLAFGSQPATKTATNPTKKRAG